MKEPVRAGTGRFLPHKSAFRRHALAFYLLVVALCVLGVPNRARAQSDNEGDNSSWQKFVDSVGATLYKLAWPTATYESVNFEGISLQPNGVDVKIKLHGISAFDSGPLWTEVVLEVRGGKIDNLRWGANNAVLAAPGETVKALGSALSQLNDEYNKEHPANPGSETAPGPDVASPDPSQSAPAAPADKIAAVCVSNPTKSDLTYRLRIEGRDEDHTVAAGQQLLTSASVSVPVFTISFDDSFADGYTDRTMQLPAETFSDTPTACDDTMTYEFLLDGQNVGLAPRKWKPGLENPFLANVVAAQTEGQWACAPGQKWSSGDPNSLDCVSNDVGLIGLTVAAEDGVQYPKITAVSPGGAADKAGIASGVYLLSVDGISMEGLSLADVVAKIRGPVNSTVHIAVSDSGGAPPRVFELQRQ